MPYKAHEPRRHKVPRARFKLIVEGVSKRFLSKRATVEALEIASGPSTNTCTGRTKDTHTIKGYMWGVVAGVERWCSSTPGGTRGPRY